ncbi:MAG: hypothetical protein QOH95_913, partial [Gaiellaceae bacterium]|nr:hypothetical protein [Gaiellaceae bacterium]
MAIGTIRNGSRKLAAAAGLCAVASAAYGLAGVSGAGSTLASVPAPVPAATVAGVTVGGGFIDASARQVLRTAGGVVYVVAADDNPCQAGGSGVIRVEKGVGAQAANAAVPASFAEQDSANHPVSARAGNCQFSSATSVLFSPDSRLDRSGTIHMAYIDTASGNVYYQTFSTATDSWGPRTVIGSKALKSSGAGWPRAGQVGLTLDANDVPHVVYATSGTANTLLYTSKAGGLWRTAVTIASGTNLMHPSIVTSLDGSLQLAWLENSLAAHATIRYARFDGTTWTAPETVSAGDAVVLANGDDDQGPSIATDPQSRAHVLFLDGTVNGADNFVRLRVRTAANTWVDDTPPGGAGGAPDPAGRWYSHTPQNYVSSAGTDFVFLGHDVNISPGGYQYQSGGPGNVWSAYSTLDPRNKTNVTAGAPGLDGTASVRFDPLRETNAGIIDVLYYDEHDDTAGYPHHATIYYKAVVVGAPDSTPPSTPAGLVQTGASATTVTLGWNASTDDVAVAGYGLYRDATLVGSPASTSGTIGGLTCGTTYTVGVDAYDGSGNRSPQATTAATTAACDVVPPTVTLTAPADGALVTGAVTVTAAADDDTAVAGVQFQVDGASLGAEDATPPYSASWDSTTSPSGPHTITAVARDSAGNVTTSAPVAVTSQNQGPAFVKDLGTATIVNTGGTIQLSVPTGGVGAGHTVVLWAEMSGAGGVTIASIADSRGNSYTADAAVNNLGVNTMTGSGFVSSPLLQGDTL